jgi:DNA-binding MarR family transcriptional regulator
MDDNIGTLMAQVSRLMRRAFDQKARTVGVTRPQWQVLALLSRNQGINQGGLAELLEVEPITLGRMIDRLQDSQMVERRPDPADRRAWRLHLTPKGEQQIIDLRPSADETIEASLEGISPEDREQLMVTLDRMRANLSRRTGVETILG